MRRIRLSGPKPKSIHFEKQNSRNESSALVAIHKRVIAYDAAGIDGSQVNDVGRFGISEVLSRFYRDLFAADLAFEPVIRWMPTSKARIVLTPVKGVPSIVTDRVTGMPALSAGSDAPLLSSKEV